MLQASENNTDHGGGFRIFFRRYVYTNDITEYVPVRACGLITDRKKKKKKWKIAKRDKFQNSLIYI